MYIPTRQPLATSLLEETNPIAEAIREHFRIAQFDSYDVIRIIRGYTGSGKTTNGLYTLTPMLLNGPADCGVVAWTSFSLEVLPDPRRCIDLAHRLGVEFINGQLLSAKKIRRELQKVKARNGKAFLVLSCHKMFQEEAGRFPMLDTLSELWPERWGWINDEGKGLTPIEAYEDTLGHRPDLKKMHETMFRAFSSAKIPFKYLLEATTTRYTSGLCPTSHGISWEVITPPLAPSATQAAAVPEIRDVLTYPVTLVESGKEYGVYHISDLSHRKIAFTSWVENHFNKETKVPQVGELVGVKRIKGVGLVIMSMSGDDKTASKYRMDVRSDLPWMLKIIQEQANRHGFTPAEIQKMTVLWTDEKGEFGTNFVSAGTRGAYNIEPHPYELDNQSVLDLGNNPSDPLRFIIVVNKAQAGVDIPRLTSIWFNRVSEAKMNAGSLDQWETRSFIEAIIQPAGRASRPHPLLWNNLVEWLGTYSLLPILQGPNAWNQTNLDLLLEQMTMNIAMPDLEHYHDFHEVFSTYYHLTKNEMRKEWLRIRSGVSPR